MTRIPPHQRRALLVQAALRVLARDGVAAASTRAIVAEAGMPLASFHYAFASRDDLLRELVTQVVAAESDATLLSLLDRVDDPRDTVRAALAAYFQLLRSDPGREQGMFELTQHALRTPALSDLPKRQYQRYHELARELLRLGAARGGYTWTTDIDDLARMVVAMTDGITLAWLADRDDAAAERALDLAASAIVSHLHERVSA